MKTIKKLQVVVETPEFQRQAALCMDDESRADFVGHIAKNPKDGAIITGTGGARKIRWTSGSNQGKRGGVRVVYYYHDEEIPIFLFTVYGKNKKENLEESEKTTLKKIIKLIVSLYKEGKS